MTHSDELKARMVERMLDPAGPSQRTLANESGISKTTLWRWLKQAKDAMPPSSKKSSSHTLSPADKLRLVLASTNLDPHQLGAFIRQEGIHLTDLEAWRQQMLDGLAHTPSSNSAARLQLNAVKRENKQLQSELRRKDAALAETAALLVLSKKVQRLWAEEDASTPGKNDFKSST